MFINGQFAQRLIMKFCSKCDTKLSQNFQDVGGPGICPKCNPEKVIQKRPTYGMNSSGKTKPCSKGCGAEIYWDEEFKSDSGKFIPIDSRTDEPHQCEGQTESSESYYYPDEVKKYTKKKEPAPEAKIPLPEEILYDITKIPKSIVDGDPIIHEIIQGHKEKSLGIIHYENLLSSESEKIPVDRLEDVLSENILSGIKKYGFQGLLPFQEESVRSILDGNNSIISAPTGSGKTEAFTIPILQKILQETKPGVFALFVYPLNALIDDQAE